MQNKIKNITNLNEWTDESQARAIQAGSWSSHEKIKTYCSGISVSHNFHVLNLLFSSSSCYRLWNVTGLAAGYRGRRICRLPQNQSQVNKPHIWCPKSDQNAVTTMTVTKMEIWLCYLKQSGLKWKPWKNFWPGLLRAESPLCFCFSFDQVRPYGSPSSSLNPMLHSTLSRRERELPRHLRNSNRRLPQPIDCYDDRSLHGEYSRTRAHHHNYDLSSSMYSEHVWFSMMQCGRHSLLCTFFLREAFFLSLSAALHIKKFGFNQNFHWFDTVLPFWEKKIEQNSHMLWQLHWICHKWKDNFLSQPLKVWETLVSV